jgi:hypothetical protein
VEDRGFNSGITGMESIGPSQAAEKLIHADKLRSSVSGHDFSHAERRHKIGLGSSPCRTLLYTAIKSRFFSAACLALEACPSILFQYQTLFRRVSSAQKKTQSEGRRGFQPTHKPILRSSGRSCTRRKPRTGPRDQAINIRYADI